MLISFILQFLFQATTPPAVIASASAPLHQGVFSSVISDFPKKNNAESLGVVVQGESALILDQKTGKVLFEKNADQKTSIASITKLMSALVFLQTDPYWDAKVTYKPGDETGIGSVKIYRGDTISLEDTFHVALAASDNNSILALVRASGMSNERFIERMNEMALEFGMNDTSFADPTGLDPENISTAHDVAILLQKASEEGMIREATTLSHFTVTTKEGKVRRIKVTDLLIDSFLNEGRYSIEMGKTGYIPEAGYCFTSLIHDTKKDASILVVSLQGPEPYSRFQDVKSMAVWAFENFDWK